MYNDGQLEILDRFTGKVQPYMWEARKRGVLFDMGHGAGGFLWPVASRAMRQGFPPDTLGTDLHPSSIMNAVNIPNCISKLMALGMTLPDAIRRATVNPARAIGRFPELGTLGEGRTADIAVLCLESGVFPLSDSRRKKLLARQRVRCVMTIRNGTIVFDEDGFSCPDWRSQES
jgi:dihydroorotase